MNKPVALITGASSGIGRSLAHVFAKNGYDLVVSARREARLEELAEELDCNVNIVAADLASSRGAQTLYETVKNMGKPVDVLVNNAGTTLTEPFKTMPREKVVDIVNLNIRALSELTHLCTSEMVERGSGRILNVASTAAFRAVPGLAVYSASKAYVLAFTEAISEELKGTGVTVTSLCPGLTKTEMIDDLAANRVPEFMMANPDDVAREGYEACMRGEVVRIPGPVNQAMVTWMEMQPRWWTRMMSGFAARASFPR